MLTCISNQISSGSKSPCNTYLCPRCSSADTNTTSAVQPNLEAFVIVSSNRAFQLALSHLPNCHTIRHNEKIFFVVQDHHATTGTPRQNRSTRPFRLGMSVTGAMLPASVIAQEGDILTVDNPPSASTTTQQLNR